MTCEEAKKFGLRIRLKDVPPAVLRGCASLATLTLHNNPITVEQLREADGFPEFNARRCAKHDKQVHGDSLAMFGISQLPSVTCDSFFVVEAVVSKSVQLRETEAASKRA